MAFQRWQYCMCLTKAAGLAYAHRHYLLLSVICSHKSPPLTRTATEYSVARVFSALLTWPKYAWPECLTTNLLIRAWRQPEREGKNRWPSYYLFLHLLSAGRQVLGRPQLQGSPLSLVALWSRTHLSGSVIHPSTDGERSLIPHLIHQPQSCGTICHGRKMTYSLWSEVVISACSALITHLRVSLHFWALHHQHWTGCFTGLELCSLFYEFLHSMAICVSNTNPTPSKIIWSNFRNIFVSRWLLGPLFSCQFFFQ